jgi:hypothetical protein
MTHPMLPGLYADRKLSSDLGSAPRAIRRRALLGCQPTATRANLPGLSSGGPVAARRSWWRARGLSSSPRAIMGRGRGSNAACPTNSRATATPAPSCVRRASGSRCRAEGPADARATATAMNATTRWRSRATHAREIRPSITRALPITTTLSRAKMAGLTFGVGAAAPTGARSPTAAICIATRRSGRRGTRAHSPGATRARWTERRC